MTAALAALAAAGALVWHPAADWKEKPDPVASPYARRGGTLRLNGGQPPKSFNAYVDNNHYTAMVFGLMYERLLGMDTNTSELMPALARRWAVSADGREFVFELDGRAKWSDGAPVSAEDVKWTFDAVVDPKNDTGPWKPTLTFFESPEIVDARTVRFRKKGDSPKDWRDILNCSSFWVLPKHAFAGRDFNKLNLVNAVVGGAYVISRAEPQVETELRRHGRWWSQNLPQCRGTMNFDRILVRYFVDNENAFEALKKRKIDVYPVYSARIFSSETGGEQFKRHWIVKRRVRNRAPIGFQGFAMNMRRAPFDDLRVRRAMAALLDRETMNRTMMNNAYFLLNSYYTDIYDDRHPCRNEMHAYDPAKAERLLAEAGWEKDPADGKLKKNGRPLSFTFLSRSSTEDKFLALFDQELRKLGITMSINRKDFANWMRDMDEFAFDMTWAAWGAGTVKYPELSWLGKEADRRGSNNITGFKSAEVDRLIAAEKGFDDAAARLDAYRRIDALIAEQVPYVLLWQTDSTRLLYWNKFGTPGGVLSPTDREESVLPYWWYDEDRAEELERSISGGGFLPEVPETVFGGGQKAR
ncbi:MAG: ABC transporter substrate-binding protein [Kiritimatiellae bacterium]|nr:ABC transporter substrate-binding protein [Kiritimatiellia bacterium]